jgi:hypothetical protein
MRASSAKKPIPGKRVDRGKAQTSKEIEPIALEEMPTISSTGEPLSGFERIFCTKCWTMFVVVAGQAAPCTCRPLQAQRLPAAFISRYTKDAVTTPILRAQMIDLQERLIKAQPEKWYWCTEFYRFEYGPTVEPLLQEMQELQEMRELREKEEKKKLKKLERLEKLKRRQALDKPQEPPAPQEPTP